MSQRLPEDVARHFPAHHKDADGLFASWRIWLCGIAYNTKLVTPQEAPKSFADLLDPKWAGKLVKAHPGYSGTVLTATHQMARDLGWAYFEKLAKQKVMQVQSAADPPKKLALGERAVMVDGSDYLITRLKEKGEPVEFVDAVWFSPTDVRVTLASWAADAPAVSDYTGQAVFYRSLQARSEDWLTVRDYLWRWDTDWFWCSRAFGAQRPAVRRLWPRRWLRSDVYWRIVAFERRHRWKARWDSRRGLPPRERLAALAFLAHFVGDLHMPLHAGDRGDRGGNDLRAAYGLFEGRRTNLHSVWDGWLAERDDCTVPAGADVMHSGGWSKATRQAADSRSRPS